MSADCTCGAVSKLVLVLLHLVGKRGILAALLVERLVGIDEDQLGGDVRIVLAAAFGGRFGIGADDIEGTLEERDGFVDAFELHQHFAAGEIELARVRIVLGDLHQARRHLVAERRLDGGLDERGEERLVVRVFLRHLEELFDVFVLKLVREERVVEDPRQIGQCLRFILCRMRGQQLFEEQRGVRQPVRLHVALSKEGGRCGGEDQCGGKKSQPGGKEWSHAEAFR